MKKGIIFSLLFSLLALSACGGGGGGNTGGGGTNVVVSGVAAKGPFISGTVNLYDVSAGISGKKLLQTGSINADGSYSFTIPQSSTPLMVEIPVTATTKYFDEANPTTPRSLDVPLRAVVPSAAANTTVAVTPFTELAAKKLEGVSLTKTAIDDANALVSQVYKVPAVISTLPVNVATTVPAGASTDAINYGLALAAVSQMMTSQTSTLSQIVDTLAVATASVTQANQFKAAVQEFIASGNNKTAITSLSTTPFATAGSTIAVQANKTVALADGSTPITLTAALTPAVPDDTEVTFTVASGAARFAGSATQVKVKTVNSVATATVTSAAAGDSSINATYVPGVSTVAPVKFALPTSAVVEVGLTKKFDNAFYLAFRLGASPTAAVPTAPTVVAINEAAGLVGSLVSLLQAYDAGVATVNLLKDNSNGPGFNIVANKPVVRLTYALTGGAVPQFVVMVSPPIPLGLTNMADPGNAAIIPSPQITASDFSVTTTFKDANGNTL